MEEKSASFYTKNHLMIYTHNSDIQTQYAKNRIKNMDLGYNFRFVINHSKLNEIFLFRNITTTLGDLTYGNKKN